MLLLLLFLLRIPGDANSTPFNKVQHRNSKDYNYLQTQLVTPVYSRCETFVLDPFDEVKVRSKNFPETYPQEVSCTQAFVCTDSTALISFSCEVFDLQDSLGCTDDFLEIHGGNGSFVRYCGNNAPKEVMGPENIMAIKFNSNGDDTMGDGYKCTAKCIVYIRSDERSRMQQPTNLMNVVATAKIPEELQESLGPINKISAKGLITTKAPWPYFQCRTYKMDLLQTVRIISKNWPAVYPKSTSCTQKFRCKDENSVIYFTCDFFDLQNTHTCHEDYMEIYDEFGILLKACGSNNPLGVVSTTNFLGVKFISNGDFTVRNGYLCDATCIPSADQSSTQISN